MNWYELQLEHEFAEEIVSELAEHVNNKFLLNTYPSVQVLTDSSVIICINVSEKISLIDCETAAINYGFKIVRSEEKQEGANLHAGCSEIWQTLELDKVKLNFYADENAALEATNADSIKIIPGTGWGTGHHPTTSLPIFLMQSEEVVKTEPKRVLDLGTGSGILALVSEKLFNASVDAIDNDELAIENANCNLRINKSKNVKLTLGTIEQAEQTQAQYDLIIANIYAQVLLPLAGKFLQLAKTHTKLILSGLSTTSLGEEVDPNKISEVNGVNQVVEEYQKHGWCVLRKLEEAGWVALLMQRQGGVRN